MKKTTCILGIVLSVFIIFLLTSCGRQAFVQKDNTVDFSKIRTYAWVEGTQKDSLTQKQKINDLVDRKIRESINRNLQQNGWREVKNNPDVVLVYDVDVQKENRNVSDPVYSMPTTRYFYNPYSRRFVPVYYPSQFMGYDNRTETIKEGTITLTLMNAGNEKTIWQGWTSSEVNGRRMTDKEIDENVKAIVRKLS
jgi:hypothetical protein